MTRSKKFTPTLRQLHWVGSVRKDILAMPEPVMQIFGYALHVAQQGTKHPQTKVLKGFGSAGVLEIVESDDGNTYRCVYTVKFTPAIYVLHCFQKKSHKGIETNRRDMDLIRDRLKLAYQHSQERNQ